MLELIKQDADAQTLANPRVRVLNNKQAKFHIGDRIPIQTSTIQSTSVAAVTSTFEYKDVGIKLNIEPTIHLNNTVTLKMGLEISNLGDAIDFGNGQKQYKFGTRNTDTVINLRDGESVIIGGLIKDEERRSVFKVPILGDIPILGKLFSKTEEGTIKTDILMSITPNIVRSMELPDKDVQKFWSGTEEAFDTKPLFVSSGKSSKPAEKPVEKPTVADAEAPAASAQPGKAAPLTDKTISESLVEIKPGETSAQLGQDLRFDLAISNIKELYSAILTLSYDPTVVEFKAASEGPFLKKDGQQTSFLFSNNIKGGTVDIYMTRIGDVGGVEGSGSLGTIVFQGKAGGTGEIKFKSIKLGSVKRDPIKVNHKGTRVIVK
jgi:general secretion pathway protein D